MAAESVLERTIEKELIPAGPARNAFKRLAVYFSTDVDLAMSMTERLKELYPERPVPYHTVESSFQHPKQTRMQRRISDLALDWDSELSKLKSEGEAAILQRELMDVNKFLKHKRNEGPRFCMEIRDMVEPLMDDYQFISRKRLAQYISNTYSSERYKLTYSLIENIFTHHNITFLTPEVVRVHQVMTDMKRRADDGVPLEIHPEEIRNKKGKVIGKQDYVMRRKGTLNPESLKDFISRALQELLGKENYEDRKFVEDSLKEFRRVQQLRGLAKNVAKSYGFQSIPVMYGFFFDVLNTDTPIFSRDNYPLQAKPKGSKRPSNLYRKLYAIALILHDAEDRGVAVNIDTKYLIANKGVYLKEIRYIQRKGIDGIVFDDGASFRLGMSEAGAGDIRAGKVASIPYERLLKLQALRNDAKDIFVIDLSDEGRKTEEYNRFIESYKGGRVLVKTGIELSSEDIRLLKQISNIAYKKGVPFLFPTPKTNIPELEDYIPHKYLFREPDRKRVSQAFR